MKRAFFTLAILSLVPALAAQTTSTTAPREAAYEETISVTGEGRIRTAPDRATFSAGVESMAPTADEAVRQNNAKVAQVLAALKAAGAADREIKTTSFSLFPQQEYVENRRPRIIGYQAVNQVTVTRDDISSIGKFLQVAVDAGANNVSGLMLTVRDPQKGRAEGLRMAMEDAKAKATQLATIAGRRLGRVLAITEGAGVYPPPRPMYGKAMAMEARASSDVPVETGSEEVTFTVSVIYAMQ